MLELCPEFVLGKYLVITSFNSGPLVLNASDFENGWLKHDELAINPSVRSVSHIPYGEYDEWYIFDRPPLLEGFKVFVNNCGFLLRDPNHLLDGLEPTWDIAAPAHHGETLRLWQELFWMQLELKRVETYLASGDRFILATRIEALYHRASEHLQGINHSL